MAASILGGGGVRVRCQNMNKVRPTMEGDRGWGGEAVVKKAAVQGSSSNPE